MKRYGIGKHSLSRITLLTTIISYSVIVALLIVLNISLLLNYQQGFIQTQQENMQTEIRRISNSLQTLQTTVSEHWYEDQNLAKLGEYTKYENLISYRYELMEELKQRMSFTQHISGFFVFYTGRETCAYVVDNTQISPQETVILKELLSAYHTANQPAHQSFFLLSSTELKDCALIGYTKGNATIYGVYSLGQALNNIQNALPSGSRLILSDGTSAPLNIQQHGEVLQKAVYSHNSLITYRSGMSFIIGVEIEGTGLKVIAQIPLSFQRLFNLQLLLGTIALIGSIFALTWLVHFLRRQLVIPLQELKQTMDNIRHGGEYQEGTKNYTLRELNEINRTFGYMMKALEKQKVATYEETLEKQKARIQYLQLQLKPHFYLNGLKTVNALALLHDTDRLQDYLQRLSVHMRYLLSLEKEEINLKQELNFTRNYIDLQREMTGRKIEYSIYQDREDPTALVPVLCIQTFVENSIKYAKLGSTDELLKISIEVVHLESDGEAYLDISIRDNGPGYPEQVLLQLQKDFIPDGENVGINNIRQRCAILYGIKASFLFENRGGAESEIIFPVNFEKEGNKK